jgi:hypothetical protein
MFEMEAQKKNEAVVEQPSWNSPHGTALMEQPLWNSRHGMSSLWKSVRRSGVFFQRAYPRDWTLWTDANYPPHPHKVPQLMMVFCV